MVSFESPNLGAHTTFNTPRRERDSASGGQISVRTESCLAETCQSEVAHFWISALCSVSGFCVPMETEQNQPSRGRFGERWKSGFRGGHYSVNLRRGCVYKPNRTCRRMRKDIDKKAYKEGLKMATIKWDDL